MPKVPALTPTRVIRVLEKAGFRFLRQKGSHQIFVKSARLIVIPHHNQDLRKGTLHHIIRQSGLSVEEFLDLL